MKETIWQWPDKLLALIPCIQANSMEKTVWKLRLRHEVIYAKTRSQQVEVLNLEPQPRPLSPTIAFLCLTLYHLYLAGQKPLISLRSLINKRHFLEKNKMSQLWAAFFWFLLAPFCFLHACVLPSGRLGVDREIHEWRWRFANQPTGCLIKCKSKHGEKRSSLSFSLQIKCYVPLAGIRSTMLGLHLLFLTAPQRALLLLFCKPASCSWRVQKETCCKKKKKKKKRFLWQERKNSKSTKKSKLKIYDSCRQKKNTQSKKCKFGDMTEDYSPGRKPDFYSPRLSCWLKR